MKYETYEVIITNEEFVAGIENGPQPYFKFIKNKFALIGIDIDTKARIESDHCILNDLVKIYVKQPIKEKTEEEKCTGVFMPEPGQRRLSF